MAKYCLKCGSANGDAAVQCSRCGSLLSEKKSRLTLEPSPHNYQNFLNLRKNKKLIITFVAVIVLLFVVISWYQKRHSIVGIWRATYGNSESYIEFREDGKGQFLSLEIKEYKTSGNTLFLTVSGGVMKYNYKISGDKLILRKENSSSEKIYVRER